MLDFYADWCVSCKEMERFTFSEPQVQQQMQTMLVLQGRRNRKQRRRQRTAAAFRIVRPAGNRVHNAAGQLQPQRVIGFVAADEFLHTLQNATRKIPNMIHPRHLLPAPQLLWQWVCRPGRKPGWI